MTVADLVAIGDSWELDGLSFNTGADGNGFSFLVKTSHGWDSGLPARPRLTERPNGSGSYRGANYRGSRVVELVGLAAARSRAEREDLMAALAGVCLDAYTLYPLTKTTSARELTLYTELASEPDITPLPDGRHCLFSIQLVATDGRKYATQLKSAQAMLAQASVEGVYWNGPGPATTGTEWNGPAVPITGTVWQASSGTGSTIALDNGGTAPTPILFTFTAPVAATLITPTVTNNDTGETMAYSGTLRAGEILTINTGTGLALLNGTPVRGLFSRFEPFEIPPRSTIAVQFSAGGPADTATMLAQWSDAYN